MKIKLQFAPIVILYSLFLYGCDEWEHHDTTNTVSFETVMQNSSAICFTSLDRSGVETITGSRTEDPSGRILAGFVTNFVKGADPFPCDRLKTTVALATFSFDHTILRTGLQSAFVDIIRFDPESPIQIVAAEPWLGVGEGYIGSPSSGPSDSVFFKIKLVSGREGTWGSLPPATVDLRSGNFSFAVKSGEQFVRVPILEEVRAVFRGGPPIRLSIEPTDAALYFKTNNRCIGLFTIRITLAFERMSPGRSEKANKELIEEHYYATTIY